MTTPLAITAHLDPLGGPLSLPGGYVHLDALLAAAVATREGYTLSVESELRPIEIPVEREPAGRFHLASATRPEWERMELRHTNRRFPVEEAAVMSTMGRVRINAGAQKTYRIPVEAGRVVGDSLTWYALGDAECVRELLVYVRGLGKRRGVGLGQVARWDVADVEPWPGFPVLTSDGRPMRHLPEGWPGIVSDWTEWRTARLSYPYWMHTDESVVTVPAA